MNNLVDLTSVEMKDTNGGSEVSEMLAEAFGAVARFIYEAHKSGPIRRSDYMGG